MHFWLINHYAVPPQYYPLARQTNFAKNLMEMGHTVTIIAASTVHNSDINLINDKQLWKRETINNIDYVLIKCRKYGESNVKRIINMCEFAIKLPFVCRHLEKPDVIVSTSMPPMSCAMGIYLAKKYRCKGISEIADLWPESIIAYGIAGKHNPAVIWMRHLERWIYKKSDSIIFVDEGDYDYIIEQGWERIIPRSKVFCISNGVELEDFNKNKERYIIHDIDLEDESIFKVVYTGSIRKVNGLGLLLDTAKRINDPRIKFLIWGKGDELPYLQSRIKEEGITNVVFKGAVEKKYIPYITSKADLNIVHNTPMELFRFGISFNKIFDYMAAGKPILCDFSCPYNPVIMTGCGIDVSDPTPEGIARQVEICSQMDSMEYSYYCDMAKKAAGIYDFKSLTCKLLDVVYGKALPIGSSEKVQ